MDRLKFFVMIAVLMIITGCSNVEGESSIKTAEVNTKTEELEKTKDSDTEIIEDEIKEEELLQNSKYEVQLNEMAGEGNTSFPYLNNMPLQVTIKNNGTTAMNFRIEYPNNQTLADDALKPNETYVNTFNPTDLVKGEYRISFLQNSGEVMSAYVKVELIEDDEDTEVGLKEEYLKKINNIKNESEALEAIDSSTYALKKVANDRWEIWDELLNEIYGVLKEQLPPEEMDQLREAQRNWIKYRDDSALEASLKYKGGTQEQLEYVTVLANLTEERCYELVEEYM